MACRGAIIQEGSFQSTQAILKTTIHVLSTFILDQNAQIFKLAMLRAQADIEKSQAKKDAIQEKS